MPGLDPGAESVLAWYGRLQSRRVDLVGDYAGNEYFIIDGDSLLRHCFTDPRIDFKDGFQMLHAVYTVELFLQNLAIRKCNFHIVFFDDHAPVAAPATSSPATSHKYLLARQVLISHLQRNLNHRSKSLVRKYPSYHDNDFSLFLRESGVYFIMCHDGCDDKESPAELALQSMILWFITRSYNVVLLNGVDFIDTRVMAPVLDYVHIPEKATALNLPERKIRQDDKKLSPPLPQLSVPCSTMFSDREGVTVSILSILLADETITQEEASLFLLHTALLSQLPISSRRLRSVKPHPRVPEVLEAFSKVAASLLESRRAEEWLRSFGPSSKLADLLDGRLLAALFAGDMSTKLEALESSKIGQTYRALLRFLSAEQGNEINEASLAPNYTPACSHSLAPCEASVLSFSNPVFDRHLLPIRLHTDDTPLSEEPSAQSRVFRELSHWHNHRKAIVQKGAPTKLNFFALRRNQWFMAEMIAYAASLTNAAGKILEPETVVSTNTDRNKQSSSIREPPKNNPESGMPKPVKTGKQRGNANKKGGKAAALEAAAALRAERSKSSAASFFVAWDAHCTEISRESNPKIQYTRLAKYRDALNKDAQAAIGSEVELRIISSLIDVWEIYSENGDKKSGLPIVALIWDALNRLSKLDTGVTKSVATELESVAKMLHLPKFQFVISSHDRPLPFKMQTQRSGKKLRPDLRNNPVADLSIPMPAKEFQLEFCGPYMDRGINSTLDSRVPFAPDDWQVKVLDAIDQDKSLFVVAPTSAGKTFISFYAMKKILQSGDDDVIVYVAPTKALVNQIAAEVQARYQKSFKHAGKSVWAVHTRDYRINNPTGCQVLITVPHILQIMLMSPAHAEKTNSWSYRVKRIIFDEIHCIGQAEDGVIWEQLLLQAQCPIIALSATVGNPHEFSSWLASTQNANGIELVTVQHEHRYSDLRKFMYVPPQRFSFSGLSEQKLLEIPGLEGSQGFSCIHPVASLQYRSQGIPSDLTFEPRDCLLVWKAMHRHQTPQFPLKKNLDPDIALPEIIRKVDIFRWENDLKATLGLWAADSSSPFEEVKKDLSGDVESWKGEENTERRALSQSPATPIAQDGREVSSEDIESTILPMLVDLHSSNALPAIVFCYDRSLCEAYAQKIVGELETNENILKEQTQWKKKLAAFTAWQETEKVAAARAAKASKNKGKKGKEDNDEKMSKQDRMRDAADSESAKWATFDPNAPLDGFHFTDVKKLATSDLEHYQNQLRDRGVPEWLIAALKRGIGVHHAGMNRKYRHVVEILFRKGYLRVVIATGTLALGINMPCKTVAFAGSSIYLTALNFRQAAGRAGRRGFDVLGNVVFLGIPFSTVSRLMSSRLPDLNGHFPITTSLVLRMFTLLHESRNSEFAIRTIDSVLSQPRLYLGSEESKVSVLHHLRFSIEYLRRQSLLSESGAPLNFAGAVSHLYYTENAAWAFNALLKNGYFHALCAEVDGSPDQTCDTLMLVLAHIFGRHLCGTTSDKFNEDVVKRSPSIVFLPPMPVEAEEILLKHNKDTLSLFQTYVRTFVDQHLPMPDNKLPFTGLIAGSEEYTDTPALSSLPATAIRSHFVALSGHGDEFESISELCRTVRSGVFLEESALPYLPVYPHETGARLNAYLYDFYKHGDVTALERANRIRGNDIWFRLHDFSLVLATIETAFANFMKLSPSDEADFGDVKTAAELFEDQRDDQAYQRVEASEASRGREVGLSEATESDDLNQTLENLSVSGASPQPAWTDNMGLVQVMKAFNLLSDRFNEKFRAMWV